MTSKGGDDEPTNVVALDARLGRPDPPAALSADEAHEWRRLVDCMPRNWFRPESFGVLVSYCRHIDRGNVLARAIHELQAQGLDTRATIDRYIKLGDAQLRHTRAILACATKLRLFAHRSRSDARGIV